MLTHSFLSRLQTLSIKRQSSLCVGLDPDFDRLPNTVPKTLAGMTSFLLEVVSATSDRCIAYKPNIAFFEAMGIEGLEMLLKVRQAIPSGIPVIADGKRGDIGNTSRMQAKFLYEYFGFDAVTLHPYMGSDSLIPFFEYKDKFNFVLALTSNPGALDFECLELKSGVPLYKEVIRRCVAWDAEYHNVGLVVGATQDGLSDVRECAENLLFLMPGIGHQGGDYQHSVQVGKNADGLVLVNVGRDIMYASSIEDAVSKLFR